METKRANCFTFWHRIQSAQKLYKLRAVLKDNLFNPTSKFPKLMSAYEARFQQLVFEGEATVEANEKGNLASVGNQTLGGFVQFTCSGDHLPETWI